jgi:hypothetical protein
MNEDEIRLRKIERQVERWDMFAKLSPTFFLLAAFAILVFDHSYFEILFIVGVIFFGITTVVWWFWTIFNIRYLTRVFRRASNGLVEVTEELRQIKNEYKALRDEENNIK